MFQSNNGSVLRGAPVSLNSVMALFSRAELTKEDATESLDLQIVRRLIDTPETEAW